MFAPQYFHWGTSAPQPPQDRRLWGWSIYPESRPGSRARLRIFFSHRSCGHPVRTHLHTANQSYMIWIWMTCVFGIRLRMRVDLLFLLPRWGYTQDRCILELSLSIYVQNNGDLRLSYCTVLSFRIRSPCHCDIDPEQLRWLEVRPRGSVCSFEGFLLHSGW